MDRWRKRFPEKRNEERKRYYDQFLSGNFNEGKWWSQEDDQLILNRPHLHDRVLHKILGRSVEAIQVRRSKLRKKICETLGVIL